MTLMARSLAGAHPPRLDCLRYPILQAGLRRLARTFQRELFAAVSPAWVMACSEDSRRVHA